MLTTGYELDACPLYASKVDAAEGANGDRHRGTSGDVTGDAPAAPIFEGLTALSRSEQFQDYLMFRPQGTKSETIWVSIGLLSWYWSGSANDEGAPGVQLGWQRTAHTEPLNPVGAASTTFPAYLLSLRRPPNCGSRGAGYGFN